MKIKYILFLSILMVRVPGVVKAQYHTSIGFGVKNPGQLFIGAILEPASINENSYRMVDVSLNDIKVAVTNIPSLTFDFRPSYKAMADSLSNRLKDTKGFSQSESFSYNSIELSSYRQVSLAFGQDVDPAVYFHLPTEWKTKKTLLMVDITQVFFSVIMDYPCPSLTNDEATLTRAGELVYVNSLQYGRKATVLVESDLPYDVVRRAVSEALALEKGNAALSEKTQSVLANCVIRTLLMGQKELPPADSDNPLEFVMDYFRKEFTGEDFGEPIQFTANHLDTNGVFQNVYSKRD